MRLGGYLFAESEVKNLGKLCEKLDCYGLSAIHVWPEAEKWDNDYCALYGETAARLGIVLGEIGYWGNMMTSNHDLREQRINKVRTLLKKADMMGCHSVVTLVGSVDPSDWMLAPHRYMFTKECRQEFREIVLRILDGLELKRTRYLIEPWNNCFFYHPEDIKEFIDSVDHPYLGLHLDQMNMISREDFFDTTGLINRTFDLLSDKIASVHLKDMRWDPKYMVMKWEETYIGDGVMDYDTYLKRLSELPEDMPCFCEHREMENDYALNFARLHYLAENAGTRFLRRKLYIQEDLC